MSKRLTKSIKNTRVLERLNEEQLLKFAEYCEVKSFRPGNIIIQAGELGEELYILIKGSCNVEVDVAKDVKHFVVALLNPGDIFGEINFLDKGARSATVVCKKSCKVAMISAERFNELTRKEPEIGIVIMRNIALIFADKVRETHEKFRDLYWKGLVTT